MIEYQDERFLARWLNGELTESEAQDFEQSEDYDALTQVLAGVDQLTPTPFDADALLSRTKTQIHTGLPPVETPVRKLRPTYWVSAAAAVILLLVLAFWFWPTASPQLYTAGTGKRLTETLPDQSTFTLNAESQLAYDAATWSAERTVTLEGEAYFTVETGQTFSVQTSLGTVQVLGTRFNVYARDQVMEVTCYEGKVAVMGSEGEATRTLQAGMSIRLAPQQEVLDLQVPDEIAEPGWMRGIYNLQEVQLRRVVEVLSRQYQVEFVTDSVDLSQEGGAAFYGNNLETALRTAFDSFNITYEQNGKVIVLKDQ